jgi:hypothetical protein
MAPKRRGRPSGYTLKKVEKIRQSVELGLPIRYACLANGVQPRTFQSWQVVHPELEDMMAESKAKFAQAHLHNIKLHARDQWTASAWLLERCQGDEFAKPEIKLQMLQVNGESQKVANLSMWSQPLPDGSSGDIEFTEPAWDRPAALPDKTVFESPPPLETPNEVRKHVSATPSQPVTAELEVMPNGADNRFIPKSSIEQALHNHALGHRDGQTEFKRLIAARPSPPPSSGYGVDAGFGSGVEMI